MTQVGLVGIAVLMIFVWFGCDDVETPVAEVRAIAETAVTTSTPQPACEAVPAPIVPDELSESEPTEDDPIAAFYRAHLHDVQRYELIHETWDAWDFYIIQDFDHVNSVLHIYRDGGWQYTLTGSRLFIDDRVECPVPADADDEAEPYRGIFVKSWSGGAHGGYAYTLVHLPAGDWVTATPTWNIGSGFAQAEDLNGDGVPEVILLDGWEYWYCCFATSAFPRVVMGLESSSLYAVQNSDYRDLVLTAGTGRWVPQYEGPAQLLTDADRLRAVNRVMVFGDDPHSPLEITHNLVNLLYAGYVDEAIEFMRCTDSWPSSDSMTKQEFWRDFCQEFQAHQFCWGLCHEFPRLATLADYRFD